MSMLRNTQTGESIEFDPRNLVIVDSDNSNTTPTTLNDLLKNPSREMTSNVFNDMDDFEGAYEYMTDCAQPGQSVILERYDGVRRVWVSQDVFGTPYENDYDSMENIVVHHENMPHPVDMRLRIANV